MASPRRRLASTLDTAVLVFVVLLALAVAWWLLKAVLGTVVLVAKLALLAVLVALAIRAYAWVGGRVRRPKSL